MPVMINVSQMDKWLDSRNLEKAEKAEENEIDILLRSSVHKELAFYPISSYVNNPAYEGAECIKPLEKD